MFFVVLVNKELMLKKGLAWHYAAYDKRVELETVRSTCDFILSSFTFNFFFLANFLHFQLLELFPAKNHFLHMLASGVVYNYILYIITGWLDMTL